MCQLFFDIKELPDYINYEYSNKLNIKKSPRFIKSKYFTKRSSKYT